MLRSKEMPGKTGTDTLRTERSPAAEGCGKGRAYVRREVLLCMRRGEVARAAPAFTHGLQVQPWPS